MPYRVITQLEQVTTAWLTTVLSRSGALTQGIVQAFDVDTGQGNWSSNARLTVHYAAASQGTRPRHLFLKLVNTDLGDESFGPSEVFYYTRDYVDVADAPLIRCYDAAYSEEQQRYHLLLDDVSETHVLAADHSLTLDYGLALAEGFAALHARWWGAQKLADAAAPIHDAAHIQRFADIAQPGVEPIIRHCSADLKPHWPDLMRDFFTHHPAKMIARAQDTTGFTLIHGDAGPYNIMVPREGTRPLYLIDRQPFDWSLTTWLGVYDLAFAIVLDWDSETRRNLEIAVLQHYHQQLLQRSVADYSWEQLWDDYRLAAAMGIYIATEYCRGGLNIPAQKYWLPRLQRSLTACDDLNCHEQWPKG